MSNNAFQNMHEYRVVDKVRESDIITSFHLKRVDDTACPPFHAGQFLVFRLPLGVGQNGILRNYSISSSPLDLNTLRITVKREPAAQPELPPGLSSNYLHGEIAVGDILSAQGPRGEFQLDMDSPRPVVLLSGGVGLTPMVSMLHALVSQQWRQVYFIHACENGNVHALGDEVRALAKRRPGVTTHFCYRSPSADDIAARRFDTHGMISKELLQKLLPLDNYDFYLCGPPPFMQAVYQVLRDLGAPRERINYEFFGPATVLDERDGNVNPRADVDAADAQAIVPPVPVAGAESGLKVTFIRSSKVLIWNDTSKSLLEFAELHGMEPPYSCRAGVCNTCQHRLLSGEVTYFEDPLDPPETDKVLLCCSRPKSAIEIDL